MWLRGAQTGIFRDRTLESNEEKLGHVGVEGRRVVEETVGSSIWDCFIKATYRIGLWITGEEAREPLLRILSCSLRRQWANSVLCPPCPGSLAQVNIVFLGCGAVVSGTKLLSCGSWVWSVK